MPFQNSISGLIPSEGPSTRDVVATWALWICLIFMYSVMRTCKSIYHRQESTNRVAMTTFWRTFHHDGNFSPAWWGWGMHSTYLPSRAKLWSTLLFLFYPFLHMWFGHHQSSFGVAVHNYCIYLLHLSFFPRPVFITDRLFIYHTILLRNWLFIRYSLNKNIFLYGSLFYALTFLSYFKFSQCILQLL